VRATAFLDIQPVRNGLGIVALKSFAPGAHICEIRGAVLTSDQVWDLWKDDPLAAANCFRLNAQQYISPRNMIGAYANHSCNPNVAVVALREWLVFKAIRPIERGCELTHDYATLLGDDDIWQMDCNCGEASCRATIARFSRLPHAVRRRYQAMGAIPDYILATLDSTPR